MNKELFHSVVGTFVPILGVITSLQEQVEYGLRISGLVVGLVVGLLSLWQILKKL
jgi:type III secretory pathway component EscS